MSIKIALVGNPNCGKTTLYNALTGANQYVGNWPGVTVEKKEGRVKWNKDVIVTDLPGIYSLSPYSPEEIVARNYIINEKPDVILNILDGSNIERNLYLTTQLSEFGIPMLVAVNMMDVVERSGDEIYLDKISEALGCRAVGISAVKKTGIKEACEEAISLAGTKAEVKRGIFEPSVEEVLSKIESEALCEIDESKRRWYAIKLLEKDFNTELDLSEETRAKIQGYIEALESKLDDESDAIVTNERYNYITSLGVRKNVIKASEKKTISDKIDKIVTNRWAAIPIFAVVMFLVYFIAMFPGMLGDTLTGWANDGVFGDGFFLFGIGEGAYNDACEAYEDAKEIISIYEEQKQNGGLSLDGEELISEESYKNALVTYTMGEPDPADDYGVWVPGIPVLIGYLLETAESPAWLESLVLDGVVGGVGAVLGFVPQLLILFILLALLEDCGYMARIAFIMDKIFRRFGLSGKSFIPMLVATGCGVPGIMASRTIESEKDRRITIMTTGFIPCGAKMPIVGFIAGAMLGNDAVGAAIISTSAYFIGVLAVIISGVILKKTKPFEGENSPFVMELPAYHPPIAKNVAKATGERAWDFIKRAGTVIFVASVVIWLLNSFSWMPEEHTHEVLEPDELEITETIEGEKNEGEAEIHTHKGIYYISEGCESDSILKNIGSVVAPVFEPLGFGNWQSSVATILGLVAKEEVVGTFGTLSEMLPEDSDLMADVEGGEASNSKIIGEEIFGGDVLAMLSFLIFNLLCAPCFAAIGAIKREMNSLKWTAGALGYMTGLAYSISMITYQIGTLFTGRVASVFWLIIAFLLLASLLYMIFCPKKYLITTIIENKKKQKAEKEA